MGQRSQAGAADAEKFGPDLSGGLAFWSSGLITLIAGIIMIFTPGPAMVFIPAGLAILATEFEWARRILRRVRPLIDAAIEKAKRKKEEVQARRDAEKGPVNARQPQTRTGTRHGRRLESTPPQADGGQKRAARAITPL